FDTVARTVLRLARLPYLRFPCGGLPPHSCRRGAGRSRQNSGHAPSMLKCSCNAPDQEEDALPNGKVNFILRRICSGRAGAAAREGRLEALPTAIVAEVVAKISRTTPACHNSMSTTICAFRTIGTRRRVELSLIYSV